MIACRFQTFDAALRWAECLRKGHEVVQVIYSPVWHDADPWRVADEVEEPWEKPFAIFIRDQRAVIDRLGVGVLTGRVQFL